MRALNVLLARHQVARRLVELCSDGTREAYLAVDPVHARALCSAGYLELEDPDDVREFGAWG